LKPNPNGRGVVLGVEVYLAAMLALAGGEKPPEPGLFVMERVKGSS